MDTISMAPQVKHLVLELRFAPTLKFYPVMDEIGIEFSDHFPDWERSPLTLELRNKKHRRRSFFSSRRVFYEAMSFTDEAQEYERAEKIFGKLHHKLNFTRVVRIGIRQWASLPLQGTFSELVTGFSKKFNQEADKLETMLRGKVRDVGYVFDVQTPNGWLYHLRFGPMERKQWFEIIPHEPAMFESGLELKSYQETFPEHMFFIDLDGYQEDIAYSDLSSIIALIRRGSGDIIADLVSHLKD